VVASGERVPVNIYIVPDFTLVGDIKVKNPEIRVPKNSLIRCSNLLGQDIIGRFNYCVDTENSFLYFAEHGNAKKLGILSRFNFSVYEEPITNTAQSSGEEDFPESTTFR
jgi:hypothetical protein